MTLQRRFALLILLLIVSIGLDSVLRQLEFHTLDAFFLDVRQQLSPNPPTSNLVTTITLSRADRQRIGRTLPLAEIRPLLDRLHSAGAKHVVFMFPSDDLARSENEQMETLSYFQSLPELYLFSRNGDSDRHGYVKHPIFSDFPRHMDAALTSDRGFLAEDGRSRRLILKYATTREEDPNILFLREQWKLPTDLSRSRWGFDFMDTLNIYFQQRSVGAYGQWSSEELREGRIPLDVLRDKIVLIGGFDEFDYFAYKSIFRRFGSLSDGVTNGIGTGACFVAELPHLKPLWELELSSPVLVAEDSPDSLETWLEILHKAGLTATGYRDPLTAEPELRTVIAGGRPFTLITDLIFQGHEQTGFDLLEIARPCTQAEKILSTSLADNADIQVLAASFEAHLIPKNRLSQLQIRSRTEP